MKKHFKLTLTSAMVMGIVMASPLVKAADTVNINITGRVVASPCVVNNGNSDLNVDLGDIQATTLAAAGTSSALKSFNLSFTNCPAGTNSVMATFSGTTDPVAGVNYYKNTGSAANVAVALIQGGTGNLKGNGTSITQSVQADRTVTMPLQAKAYSSAGGAVPGTINATVVATMQYN